MPITIDNLNITIQYIFQTEYGDKFENEFTLEQVEQGYYYDWFMKEVPDEAKMVSRKIKVK